MVAIDSRPSPGYARRGGFYGVTFHDFATLTTSTDSSRWTYEAIQHIPLLREAWVPSLRGFVETTTVKDGEQVPFFMLPANGGGSDLRGFSSWRFRDRNSVLVQAEWRIMVNRYLDTAVFFDAGKVEAHRSDLNLDGLKTDGGFGIRFHGRWRRRSGSISRRATKACPSCSAHPRCSEKGCGRMRVDLSTLGLIARAGQRAAPGSARRVERCALRGAGLRPGVDRDARFYRDDPIAKEPPVRRLRRPAVEYRLDGELATNLFVTANYKPSNTRAGNINTIDELPDSTWFTNRVIGTNGTTAVFAADLARGPEMGGRRFLKSG
jgi:hypothetical protein